jgi:hypothetical protein
MEISMEFPQETENRTARDPAIPPSGIYLKEYKSTHNHDNLHGCPTSYDHVKENVVHVHNGAIFNLKEE